MANLTFDFLHNYVTGERRASDPADAYQYDEGHVLEAVVPVAVTSCEIQYWIRGMEKADAYTPTSITQNTDNTYTILGNIPNSYFETNGDLRVYIVVTDGDASITTYEGYIHIKERQMPEDYVDDDPENEAVRVIAEARAAAATATEKAGEAAASAEQAQEILDSIPEDYTELTEEVGNLKEELSESVGDLKSTIKDISSSQLSGYFNLLKSFNNVTIHNNTRSHGFTATPTGTSPIFTSENGYTTAIIPMADVTEDAVITLFAPASTAPNSYCVWGRYSSSAAGFNMVPSTLIETYSGWDASYNSSTKELTVNVKTIKQSSTMDMFVFCWYDQEPVVLPAELKQLDSGVIQLKNIIGSSQLTEELQTVLTNAKKQQDCELILPRNIPVVSGTQLNVYYENILYGRYLKDAFVIRQQDAIAGTYRDNVWQYTPSVTDLTFNGSNFRLFAYNLHDYIVKSTYLRFVPKSYASGSYKGIVIGDSKIAMGTLMNTLNELFSNDGTTAVQFLGTLQTASGVKHEGRAGWSSKSYCEDASYLGSTNAFLYNGAFDFGHYLSAHNISTPDFVCINLGTNDTAQGLTYAAILNYYQTMIDSIHAVSADIKVIIGLTENLCQLQFNYSTNKDRLLGFVRSLIAKWDTDVAIASKIYLCPLYVNMNLYKDYNFTEVAESERNPELIPVPTDYVHQSTYGFYKNADMMYGTIKYYLGM